MIYCKYTYSLIHIICKPKSISQPTHTDTQHVTYSTCNNIICSYIDYDDLIQCTVIIAILLAFRKLSLHVLIYVGL